MADEWVAETLRIWDLETLIPTFKANCITQDMFECLNKEMINELIEDEGINFLFTKKYDEWKINNWSNDDEDEQCNAYSGHDERKKGDCFETITYSLEEDSVQNANETAAPLFEPDSLAIRDLLDKEEFLKLLRSNVWGHLFIAKYKNEDVIDTEYLWKAVIPTLVLKKPNYELDEQDFEDLLKKVKLLAPGQNVDLDGLYANNNGNISGSLYYGYTSIRMSLIQEKIINDSTKSRKQAGEEA